MRLSSVRASATPGGEQPDPTYHRLGDHTETLQLDFDPLQVSYLDLLELFWTAHDPTRQIQSRQYKRAVFYHDAAQRELAIRSRDQLEKALRRPTVTEILPATRFYLAEAYHQKYHLRQSHELLAELTAIYPISTDLLNSTAAARVNGLLGGHDDGRIDRTGLGLSARAQSLLG